MQWRDLGGNLGAAYRPLTLVTTDSLAGKAGTAPIKTGGEMRKTRVNTGFHAHAESVGRLRRLRKSRYSLNNPETWLEGLGPGPVELFPYGPPFFCEETAALAALGDVSGLVRVSTS